MGVCQMQMATEFQFNPAKNKKTFLHQHFHHIFSKVKKPYFSNRFSTVSPPKLNS